MLGFALFKMKMEANKAKCKVLYASLKEMKELSAFTFPPREDDMFAFRVPIPGHSFLLCIAYTPMADCIETALIKNDTRLGSKELGYLDNRQFETADEIKVELLRLSKMPVKDYVSTVNDDTDSDKTVDEKAAPPATTATVAAAAATVAVAADPLPPPPSTVRHRSRSRSRSPTTSKRTKSRSRSRTPERTGNLRLTQLNAEVTTRKLRSLYCVPNATDVKWTGYSQQNGLTFRTTADVVGSGTVSVRPGNYSRWVQLEDEKGAVLESWRLDWMNGDTVDVDWKKQQLCYAGVPLKELA